MSSVTGNLCNKCPKWLVEQNSSYSDYCNAISGFTSNSRAPGDPVTVEVAFQMLVYYDSALFKWIREYTTMIFLATCKSCHIHLIIDYRHRQSMFSPVNRGFSNFEIFKKKLEWPNIHQMSPKHVSDVLAFHHHFFTSKDIANSRNISLDSRLQIQLDFNPVFDTLYKVGINGNICIKGFNSKKSYLQWSST